MPAETGWVNPKTLRQLREASGLTIESVATQSQKLQKAYYAAVTPEQLRQWEAGQGSPDLEHLETLAELYQCPVGYFFLESPPQEKTRLSFRGVAPGKEQRFGPTTRRSLRRFLQLAEWFVTMLEEHGIDWHVQVPKVCRDSTDAETLAQRVRRELSFDEQQREHWQSAEDAFDWWRRRIEAQGVFCFELKLEPRDVRGASLWIDGRYPFILVNRQDAEAATGRLFTLFHEYSHLLLDRGRHGIACDFRGRQTRRGVEPFANRFAASVLLPPGQLRNHLEQEDRARFRTDWPDAELTRLARRFFVSRDVVAITLEATGLAPPGFYQRKRDQWEKRFGNRQPWGRGKARKKWERKARELGTSALRVILELERRSALPVLDTVYLLDTKVERLDEFIKGFEKVVQEQ